MIASSFSKHFILSGILAAAVATGSTAFAKEPTCLGGETKPAKIRAGAAGFENEDITIVEGVSGPEVRIGKTVIFLDPTRQEVENASEPSRNNNWCIIDPDLARQRPGSKPNEPHCNPFGEFDKSSGLSKEPIIIKGSNGQPVAKIFAKESKDSVDGKKKIELIFQGLKGTADNKMVISGHVTGKDKQSKVKLRVESKNVKDDKVNGLVESTIEGNLVQSSNSNDPRSYYNFASCRSSGQAQGQLRKKEDKAPENWVDLSGSHITMRGNERYGIDRYNPTEDTAAQRPQFMVDNAGRN